MTPVATGRPGRPAASTRQAALELATERFLAAERVDVQAIARELGLARATMHRWFQTRELLLGEVLGTLAEQRLAAIRCEAGGHGAAALLATLDSFNREVAATRGLRALLAQEQERALRILTSSAGLVQPRVVASIERLIEAEVQAGNFAPPIPPDVLAYAIVRLGEAFLYNDALAGSAATPNACARSRRRCSRPASATACARAARSSDDPPLRIPPADREAAARRRGGDLAQADGPGRPGPPDGRRACGRWLPAGWRVHQRVVAIIREEMDAIGAQEMLMPVLQPAEPWRKTGRIEIEELFKLTDRKGSELVLAMTHEEAVTFHIAQIVRSYRDLPLIVYHFQVKERDEPRPRAGVLRTREFVMKDSYSFDRDQAGLEEQLRSCTSAPTTASWSARGCASTAWRATWG